MSNDNVVQADDAAFEALSLSALQFIKSTFPNRTVFTKQFQNVIRDYCRLNDKEEISWHTTTFPTLTSFLCSLEQKGKLNLSEDKSRVLSINNTQPKNSRKKKMKTKDQSKPTTNKENNESVSTSTKSSPSKRRSPLEDISVAHNTKRSRKSPPKQQPAPSTASEGAPVCPICFQVLHAQDDASVNTHIDDCLTRSFLRSEDTQQQTQKPQSQPVAPPPPVETPTFFRTGSKQYVTQILEADLTQPAECTICFEPFLKGEQTVRFECLCVYHANCFTSWKRQSEFCPLHVPLK